MTVIEGSGPDREQNEPKDEVQLGDLLRRIPLPAAKGIRFWSVEKKFAKHQAIFQRDDVAENLWCVKKGLVKEEVHSAEGRNLVLSVIGQGGLFGTGCLDGGDYGCNAVAETDATVEAIPFRSLQVLWETSPQAGMVVVAQLSALLEKAKEMRLFAHERADKRILRALMNLSEQFGNTVPLTRSEIGAITGLSPETCVRTLVQLGREGLISSERGKVTLLGHQRILERLS